MPIALPENQNVDGQVATNTSFLLTLALCSLGSFLCGLYITCSCWMMWLKRRNPQFQGSPAYFLTYHAFYIALGDLIWHLPFLLHYLWSFVNPDWKPDSALCTVIAATNQISGTFAAVWYIALVFSVIYMIKDARFLSGINPLQYTLNLQTACTTIFAVVSTLIPWHHYGYIEEFEHGGWGCWINDKPYQLIFYGWIVVSLLSDLVLLLYSFTCVQLFWVMENGKNLQSRFMRRVYLIVLIDFLVWLLPLAYRVYIFFDLQPPRWLSDGHNLLLVSVGMANAVIWTTTEEFESVFISCGCRRTTSENLSYHRMSEESEFATSRDYSEHSPKLLTVTVEDTFPCLDSKYLDHLETRAVFAENVRALNIPEENRWGSMSSCSVRLSSLEEEPFTLKVEEPYN